MFEVSRANAFYDPVHSKTNRRAAGGIAAVWRDARPPGRTTAACHAPRRASRSPSCAAYPIAVRRPHPSAGNPFLRDETALLRTANAGERHVQGIGPAAP